MPLYEYKCKKCKKTFEVLQKINSEPLKDCFHCSGNLEKLISISSFQFKGSGWYITDYKNKHANAESRTDKIKTEKKEPKKDNKVEKNKNALIK